MKNQKTTLLSFVFFLLITSALNGQDITSQELESGRCKPGVVNSSKGKGLLLEYGALWNREDSYRYSSYQQETDDDDLEKSRVYEILKFKLKAPVVYRPGFAVLLGFSHQREEFQFTHFLKENAGIEHPLFDEVLIRSNLSLNAFKSLSGTRYLALRVQSNYNGDYKQLINFDSRYNTFKAGLIYGIKNRPDKELAIGLAYSKGIRRSIAYPFLIYNRTFDKNWGIETILPVKIYGRYNLNPKNIFLFGAEFSSREFFVDLEDQFGIEQDFRMTRQEIRMQLVLEKQLSSWIWMTCKAGHLHSLAHRFEELNTGPEPEQVRIRPGNSVFFKIGVFLSPPSSATK